MNITSMISVYYTNIQKQDGLSFSGNRFASVFKYFLTYTLDKNFEIKSFIISSISSLTSAIFCRICIH